MNRIHHTIQKAREQNRKLFIPFITSGYPEIKDTIPLILALERAGADIIELGIPFSDPIADGPVIQRSSFEALQRGFSLRQLFPLVKELRKKSEVPLLFFTYYNPVFHWGVKDFCERTRECGVDGLLIPDLPPDEAEEIRGHGEKNDISLVFLVAPTTTPERIKLVEKCSTDFIYCVSVTGTTGVREGLSQQVEPFLQYIRQTVTKPFVVGFGIATPDDVRRIARLSDGVVVGSALIKFISEHAGDRELYHKVEDYMKMVGEPLRS